MEIVVKVKGNIYQPVNEVFDAIVNPTKIVGYFVSSTSHEIEEGQSIIWEFKDYNISIEVKVKKLIPMKHISFEWSASGSLAIVNINLTWKQSLKLQSKSPKNN